MLIIALVLALIGLVALVFAVVTSNELVAWVCIGASVLGVVLLIIDAIRERQQREAGDEEIDEGDVEETDEGDVEGDQDGYVDYPVEAPDEDAQDAETGEGDTSDEGRTDPTDDSAVRAKPYGDDTSR